MRPDVLILGGGIIGLACARELARAGLRVELVERLPAGAEASIAAAGMLSPLAEVPVPGPFFDACRASRDLWLPWVAELEEETGLFIEHDTSGSLLLALDDAEAAHVDRLVAAARELGERAEEIDAKVVSDWVPDIAPDLRRAVLLPGEHRVDNIQACAILAASALRAGAILTYGFEVETIERAGDGVRVTSGDQTLEAGLLLLTAGAWSGQIAGIPPLPVHPVRGQMLLLGGIGWSWTGSVRGLHGYAVRRGETGLLIGATVEEAGFFSHTTVDGIGSLLSFARRTFPGLAGARLESTWAGLRPGTPDGLPLIGPLPDWPVVAATGHFRNGILLAPWTAREIARIVLDGGSPESEPFSPTRFPSG